MLIVAINFAPVPGKGALAIGLAVVAVAAAVAFVLRQRAAAHPLFDLHVAGRPTFWVAAVAGLIVFGSLMGAIFIGQQFLQDVLGYSTLQAGLANLPQAFFMVAVAPASARLIQARGSRFTLLTGYLFVLLGFLTMLLLWQEHISYGQVGLAYALIGIGVGFAATPASHSLTDSVPVRRVGMASGTADLQRDLGGAIMQSIFGALLTAGYATAFTKAIAASPHSLAGLGQRPEPAHEVLRRRAGRRAALPEVRQRDHLGGPVIVLVRRQMGLYGRDRRRAARSRAGLR